MLSSKQFLPVARIGRSVPESGSAAPTLPRQVGLALLSVLLATNAQAAPPPPRIGIPQPCAGGVCGTAVGARNFVQGYGKIVVNGKTVAADAPVWDAANRVLTINQNADNLILNWSSFNVAQGNAVRFVQPTSSSAVLNHIYQADPSVIQGQLSANGQVYLLNQNGIVFGQGAQLSLGGLVASSLRLNDSDFLGSIFSPARDRLQPLLSDLDAGAAGAVSVLSGASISTSGTGGRVLLAAPNVQNNGTISTPDGQVILAAGGKIYVQKPASGDLTNRGLLVTVDDGNQAVNRSGSASNAGTITARHGNVTVAGLTVNQQGVINADSSVTFNGSIYLVAGTGASLPNNGGLTAAPTRGGQLTLAPGSVTAARPDLADASTAVDSQLQLPGTIVLEGLNVRVGSGAQVAAPGGLVNVVARSNLDPTASATTPAVTQGSTVNGATVGAGVPINGLGTIVVDDGAVIDVSGSKQVNVPVTRNFIQVQLLGNELQDSPTQRNGTLYRQTVTVDVRGVDANGNIPVANIASAVARIDRTVAERTTNAGTINLDAGSLLALRAGATLDLSGGYINFQGGYAATTQLIAANGKVYDIMTAPAALAYTGFVSSVTQSNAKWGTSNTWQGPLSARHNLVEGYLEGRNAGQLNLSATQTELDASVLAQTLRGPNQRTLVAGVNDPKLPANWSSTASGPTPPANLTELNFQQAPLGGLLNLGDANHIRAQNIMVSHAGTTLDAAITDAQLVASGLPPDKAATTLVPFDALVANGMTRFALFAADGMTLAGGGDYVLPAGSALQMSGNHVLVGATVSAPSSRIVVNAIQGIPGAAANNTSLTVAPGVRLDVSGQWVNDASGLTAADRTTLLDQNAGSITLSSQQALDLGAQTVLDVSGGAYLGASSVLGSSGYGKAGTLSLSASDPLLGRFTSGATFRGFGFGKGGSLSLSVPQLKIGSSAGVAGTTLIDPGLFAQGGFASYALTSAGSLQVDSGANVAAIAQNYQLSVNQIGLRNLPTGTPVAEFASPGLLPVFLRNNPVSISLTDTGTLASGVSQSGVLSVGAGATVQTDPGGSISLSSTGRLYVDGTLSAPSGTIAVNLQPSNLVTNYDARQSLWLGPDARLLAAEVARTVTDGAGRVSGGLVRDGANSVTLNASRGILVAEPGSVIDVAGTSVQVDIPANARGTLLRTLENGAAGTVTLSAGEAIVLGGTLNAHAGGTGAAGGTLNVTLDQSLGVYQSGSGASAAPNVEDRVNLTQGQSTALPMGLVPGAVAPLSLSGKASLSVAQIEASGFDQLVVRSRDSVGLSDSGSLSLGRAITVNAPAIVGASNPQFTLAAPVVTLQNTGSLLAAAPSAASAGSLNVVADQIDLAGQVALTGFANVNLQSQGGIRATGLAVGVNPNLNGGLRVGGNLVLDAAVIYPSTLSSFGIQASREIDVRSSASVSMPVPLSAGGSLSFSAPVIVQGGVIEAPFGSLSFAADQQLSLGAGSVTSVSGSGLTVPFGTTINGTTWYGPNAVSPLGGTPAKAISLAAGSKVTISAGANVDLSGGGDLLAYESVVGPGGSKDILNGSATYALLPGTAYASLYAPIDPAYAQGGAPVTAGQAVYLSAGPAGPGVYTLLPSHYALLAGAYAVQSLTAATAPNPGVALVQTDGSILVAGKSATLNSGVMAPTWSTWRVLPSTTVHAASQLDTSLASAFFTAQSAASGTLAGTLPGDAGRLTLVSGGNIGLSAGAKFAFSPESRGRGGEVDIGAQAIAVVSQIDMADASLSNYLQLESAALDALGASRLVLGGTLNPATGLLTEVAQQLLIRNDAQHPLQAPDLVLTARQTLAIAGGSVLQATAQGTDAGPGPAINIVGDGALVRLTASSLPDFRRTPGSNPPVATLSVGAGGTGAPAVLQAGGSLTLDSAGSTVLASGTVLDTPALRVDAQSINLGSAPAAASGVSLDTSVLAKARQLVLQTPGALRLYGDVTLGSLAAPLDELTIDAPTLLVSTPGHQEIDARVIALQNSSPAAAVSSGGSVNGTLVLHAVADAAGNGGVINAGQGAVDLAGAGNVQVLADHALVTNGTGSLRSEGALLVQSPAVQAAAGSNYAITAVQTLALTAPAQPVPASQDVGAGGRIALNGAGVDVATLVSAPAGQIQVHATGNGRDVTIAATGALNAAGYQRNFQGTSTAADGGTISVLADSGNLMLRPGSALVVDAVQGAGAGTVSLTAEAGHVDAQGRVSGIAASGQMAGQLAIDVGSLVNGNGPTQNPDSLLAMQASGGFNEAFALHVRQGDVNLTTPARIASHNISVEVDAGSLFVGSGNSLQATSDGFHQDGGTIALWAGNNLTLAGAQSGLAAASLDASSVTGKAGQITLGLAANSPGKLNVAGDVSVGLNGAAGTSPGLLALRVPRNPQGTGVAIGSFAPVVTGNPLVTLEAVKLYDTAAPIYRNVQINNAFLQNTAVPDAQALMNNESQILQGLNLPAGAFASLLPGVEVWYHNTASSPVRIASNAAVDLSSLRFGRLDANGNASEPGVLTIRSSGSMALNGALSDAFDNAGNVQAVPVDGTGTATCAPCTWSYRLVAGADLGASNPLQTSIDRATGNLALGSSALIRTGDGNIALAAAGDISFARSGPDVSASVYTAGLLKDFPSSLQPFDYGTVYQDFAGNLRQFTAGGGSIAVNAGGNVTGSSSQQVVNNWLYRSSAPLVTQDGVTAFDFIADGFGQTNWWVQFDAFHMDVGALGGGNVSIQARGDVANLSVALPTNGRQGGGNGTLSSAPSTVDLFVSGGGNLAVTAGGDLLGGAYYVEKGAALLRAGGNVMPGLSAAAPYPMLLALGDAQIKVEAGGVLDVMTAYNPFLLPQSLRNVGAAARVDEANADGVGYFTTYTPQSSVNLLSAGGDVAFGGGLASAFGPDGLAGLKLQPGTAFVSNSATLNNGYSTATILPGTLSMTALGGNVALNGGYTLSPAPTGNLVIQAGKNVDLTSPIGGVTVVTLSASDPASLPTPVNPGNRELETATLFGPSGRTQLSAAPVHQGDPNPVTVVAATGSIIGSPGGLLGTELISSKPVNLTAALDVSGVSLLAQNLLATDVTSINAGRDISPSPLSLTTGRSALSVAGPGEFLLTAGHNVGLGASFGITSGLNPFQTGPAQGASIAVYAGLGQCGTGACLPDFATFSRAYIDPASALARLHGNTALLQQYVAQLDGSVVTADQAWVRFNNLSDGIRENLIEQVLANELSLAAIAHNLQGTNYSAGYAALGTLFPGSVINKDTGLPVNFENAGNPKGPTNYVAGASAAGNISMFYSQVRTLAGGSIGLFAPQGGLDVGLANNPKGIAPKQGNALGVVTQQSGNVVAVTGGNINVNSSRIFTVGGGDITLWSSFGNIDAGRGAKSVVLVPPPTISVNAQGVVTITTTGATNGSGIGALLTGPGQVPGNVSLIAPVGVVDAGDAGIRAAGNLNIAAATVLNASNISVGGTSTGVPQTESVAIAAPASASNSARDANSAADAATKRLADAAQAGEQLSNAFKPTILTVDVVGEDEDAADLERKRRGR